MPGRVSRLHCQGPGEGVCVVGMSGREEGLCICLQLSSIFDLIGRSGLLTCNIFPISCMNSQHEQKSTKKKSTKRAFERGC